ncbi:MAG: class I SAM-dependent methyltransferase [Specibacter sp.]
MTDHAHHHHMAGHSHQHGDGLAEMLNLDAIILGTYLDEATAWAAGLAPAEPATILDVGAGSGAGTLALAKRFPDAHIVAIDMSPDMLAHTRQAAHGQGLDGRLATVEANLDEAWPEIASADLIWAASSLHELADPESSMRDMFAALNPGGLLVVVEMDALPRFLTDTTGLESRLHAALALQGWNAHPDWRPGLEKAGFDVVEQRSFPTTARSTPEPTARYAQLFLGRIRQGLDGIAAAEDLAALDRLLTHDGPESLANRTDLQVRGSRTAWAARKP